MGVRSDVAICMKECVVNHLSPDARRFLKEWGFVAEATLIVGDGVSEDQAGSLFVTGGVKWYAHSYDEIVAFYQHLEECHDEEDWLIVVATPEYPKDVEGDAGGWDANPWGVYKAVSVALQWS